MKENWQAHWIWSSLPENTPNVYLEARKTFELPSCPEQANLFISANQEYLVYINGREAGRGPSPSDQQWKYFDHYDVGPLLTAGPNVVAVLVYHFGSTDIVTKQMQGPGGLIAELEIDTGSAKFSVSTDSGWKVRRSPRWVEQVSRQHQWNGFREIYRAEREDSWEQAAYDDSEWENATVIAKAGEPGCPWPRLLPREIPKLLKEKVKPYVIVRTDLNFGRVESESAVLSGSSKSGGEWKVDARQAGSLPGVVFDFAKEIVGYPELEADAPEGGVIQLWYGESLDMQLYDTFILKKGPNRLKPFGRRAFRFLYVTFQATPAPVTISMLEMEAVRYPFEFTGTFQCSDPLLNRIWETGVYTTQVNSQDHLEDCPLREKALWVADAVVMAKVIYHVFGDDKLLRKCLLQGARIQNSDGSIPGTGPERNPFVLPDFCAHWLFGVYEHWLFTKDRSFAQEIWPAVCRVMEWFAGQEDEDGLFARADREGWWCFIDWADYIDRRDRVTAVNCFYYKALRLAADMAEDLGNEELAGDWKERAGRLRTSIRSRMRLPGETVFADCIGPDGLSSQVTAQTNFAAIWSGVADPEEADRFLSEWYEQGKTPALKGAFFYHIVLETLVERGRILQALQSIRAYWGGMLERGATTWWETFDPATPSCTIPSPYQGNTPTYLLDHIPVSACHGWGASPSYILTQLILGVDLRRLGDKEIHLNPHPGDLEWAEGSVPTRYGWMKAKWSKQQDGTLRYEVTVPHGVLVKTSRGNMELILSITE